MIEQREAVSSLNMDVLTVVFTLARAATNLSASGASYAGLQSAMISISMPPFCISAVNDCTAPALPLNKSVPSYVTVVPTLPNALLMAFTTRCTSNSLDPAKTSPFDPAFFKSCAALATAACTASGKELEPPWPVIAWRSAVATFPCSEGFTMVR